MKKLIVAACSIAVLFVSCKKQFVVCSGNCYQLPVNGSVVNALTNKPAPNVPVVITRWLNTIAPNRVDKISANANGVFSKMVTIDSMLFQNGYLLTLSVENNTDFIPAPDRDGLRMYEVGSNVFQNVRLLVYPKATLTFKLSKTMADNFTALRVDYYFIGDKEKNALSVLSPQDISKQTISVATSADLFTKIRITRANSAGVYTTTLDSIKCTQGIENVYPINY